MPPVTTSRPPTEEEQVLLREPPLKLFGWWTGIVSGLCIFVLAFLMVLLASPVLPVAAVLPAAVAVGMIAFLASYGRVQRRERRALRQAAERVAREVAAGYVKSTTYTVNDAVAVEEGEDEGFPWASFEIVQAPVEGWVLRVAQRGPALAPSRTRRPFSDKEYRSGAVPEDGTIERRDFNALKTEGRRTP